MNNKYLIYGCMFSGKTSKLQSLIKHCKQPHAVFVHKLQGKFTTHDFSQKGDSPVQNLGEKFILTDNYEEICRAGEGKKIWFFDEIQFFDAAVVEKLIKRPETMYFAGLDTDFNGVPFATTQMLIGSIEALRMKAICECGEPAIHSKLTISKPSGNILIGDDFYVPACAACFLR